MIILKTEDEIEQIKISCLLVSDTLAYIATLLRPGISPKELDNKAYEYIKDHKASPSFLNYRGFPASLCISKNEVVVHGIPDDKALQDNDLVSVDCGVYFQGFHGDSAYTFCLGEPEEAIIKLCKITKESLYKGIDEAKVGNRIG
ncbi:MAG TPA: M24 family metallopeptidase, partial [Saprospiraceae bacterium]|nr:M24 family metallopeptidase [Saprospiraceae bacterium]